MPEIENIHACWSLMPQFDKKTGELTTAGLLALGGRGGDGALRELKKRCDAEREIAKKPLVGCAMYVNLIYGWAKVALDHKERLKGTEVIVNYAADKSFRQGFERSFRLTGEDAIADIIEETWAQYQKEESIPDSVIMDVEEEIAAILEDEYCTVGLVPDNFSEQEIEQSKEIALRLGVRKPRRRRTPAPEESSPEEELVEPEEIAPELEEEPAPPSADADTADAIEEAVRKAIK